MISGTLKAVAVSTSEITLRRETGAELVLGLGAGAQIVAGHAVTPIDDLDTHIGSNVDVIYGFGRTLADLVEVGPRGKTGGTATASGTLDMVGVLSGMIAVLTDSGDPVVVKATGDTEVLVNDALASLAELVVGRPVIVTFDPESNTAVTVIVGG